MELFPAFHYIFCSASLHKRMPFQSGLGRKLFIKAQENIHEACHSERIKT
ncbi:hypothetical protein ACFP3I_08540 [Chryseobacterium arachidis]